MAEKPAAEAETTVSVRLVFGQRLDSDQQELKISVSPSCSIQEVKRRLTADDILLSFGPNDRKLGAQYRGDPAVDETALRLGQFSVLAWLARFSHWQLSVSLLPPAPPPPGVAIHHAAASAEGKDPERAVQDARGRGEIPRINELPAPWGPKPSPQLSEAELLASGHLPPKYPDGSSPLVDAAA
eukprot:scaffold3.g6192.t1